jgi:TRAP-type mannitol/chloroaromatic compound transport system permease large subunit
MSKLIARATAFAMAGLVHGGGGPGMGPIGVKRGMADFMVLQVIGLLLVMLFPKIALWFPAYLFGE